MQAWYCEVNAIASMKLDWIPPSALLGLSLIWFSVHGLTRAWHSIHGAQFHSYESGIGILARLFPGWSDGSQAIASDLCVSMAMSLVLWLFQSPILSGWYAAMCMWLILGHLWVYARDARRRQSWIDSQTEAEIWSEQIQRRN